MTRFKTDSLFTGGDGLNLEGHYPVRNKKLFGWPLSRLTRSIDNTKLMGAVWSIDSILGKIGTSTEFETTVKKLFQAYNVMDNSETVGRDTNPGSTRTGIAGIEERAVTHRVYYGSQRPWTVSTKHEYLFTEIGQAMKDATIMGAKGKPVIVNARAFEEAATKMLLNFGYPNEYTARVNGNGYELKPFVFSFDCFMNPDLIHESDNPVVYWEEFALMVATVKHRDDMKFLIPRMKRMRKGETLHQVLAGIIDIEERVRGEYHNVEDKDTYDQTPFEKLLEDTAIPSFYEDARTIVCHLESRGLIEEIGKGRYQLHHDVNPSSRVYKMIEKEVDGYKRNPKVFFQTMEEMGRMKKPSNVKHTGLTRSPEEIVKDCYVESRNNGWSTSERMAYIQERVTNRTRAFIASVIDPFEVSGFEPAERTLLEYALDADRDLLFEQGVAKMLDARWRPGCRAYHTSCYQRSGLEWFADALWDFTEQVGFDTKAKNNGEPYSISGGEGTKMIRYGNLPNRTDLIQKLVKDKHQVELKDCACNCFVAAAFPNNVESRLDDLRKEALSQENGNKVPIMAISVYTLIRAVKKITPEQFLIGLKKNPWKFIHDSDFGL